MNPATQIIAGGQRRHAGGGPPTSPVMANLVQWLRAESLGLSDNDPISTFTDLSGAGNSGTQIGILRAIYKSSILNGKAVARDDGSKYYDLAGIAVTDFSAFVVVNQTGDNGLWGNVAGSAQIRVGESGNNVIATSDGLSNPISSTLGVSQGNWSILAWNCVGGTVTFYQNGTSYGTGSFLGITFTKLLGLGAIIPLNGDWAESLFYNAGLSGGDVATNFAYLNGEFAIY